MEANKVGQLPMAVVSSASSTCRARIEIPCRFAAKYNKGLGMIDRSLRGPRYDTRRRPRPAATSVDALSAALPGPSVPIDPPPPLHLRTQHRVKTPAGPRPAASKTLAEKEHISKLIVRSKLINQQ